MSRPTSVPTAVGALTAVLLPPLLRVARSVAPQPATEPVRASSVRARGARALDDGAGTAPRCLR